MLSLIRKPNQSICIGDDIVITVRLINKEYIELAIDAPDHTPISGATSVNGVFISTPLDDLAFTDTPS